MSPLPARAALIAVAFLAGIVSAQANRLDTIRARGAVAVGVKTEYPPFGMLDGAGRSVGFEPDLAADLSRRLKVELHLVPVTTANRLQKLAEGSIDVLIATLGDTKQRREIAALIEPDYYASGVNVMLPESRKVADWTELRGNTLCTMQGAYYNRPMTERYLLNLQIYNGTRDAKLAMRDGRCDGWLYDDTAIAGEMRAPEWRDYAMPLPSLMLSPWAIAIEKSEEGGDLDRLIGDAVADWHRSGFLVELERKWQLKPSAFLQHAHAQWSEKDDDGAFVCARGAGGSWPARCRDEARANSEGKSRLEQIGLRIRELTGLDLTLVYDSYDRDQFLRGLLTSIALVIACVLGSALMGAAGAVLLDARIAVISRAVGAIATVGRMTPPLLQIYVVVFGLGSVTARWGLTPNAFLAVTLCLSLYAGSACAVALTEAADLLRQHRPDFRIVPRTVPLAFRLAYHPIVAALVNIVKATGMASAVAVPELISTSTGIIAERGNPEVMMNALMVAYFLLVLVVIRLFGHLHRWIVADERA
ncbi:MAG: transporter substrate-binding domain-containing protein [Alphaproteobacteria bacterium]|nr:transporter substrate-binding domain-containing protein [Alphaproteobacteria bacterium]